jgi:hypothetical protein
MKGLKEMEEDPISEAQKDHWYKIFKEIDHAQIEEG